MCRSLDFDTNIADAKPARRASWKMVDARTKPRSGRCSSKSIPCTSTSTPVSIEEWAGSVEDMSMVRAFCAEAPAAARRCSAGASACTMASGRMPSKLTITTWS